MKKTAYTFDTENIEYLKTLPGGENKVETFVRVCKMRGSQMATAGEQADYKMIGRCLTFMKEYGDNRWWASDDERIMAYYQIMNTRCMLVPIDKFQTALEFLLGRPVMTHEFAFNLKGLREEAEAAFHGRPHAEAKKIESVAESFTKLADAQRRSSGLGVFCI